MRNFENKKIQKVEDDKFKSERKINRSDKINLIGLYNTSDPKKGMRAKNKENIGVFRLKVKNQNLDLSHEMSDFENFESPSKRKKKRLAEKENHNYYD